MKKAIHNSAHAQLFKAWKKHKRTKGDVVVHLLHHFEECRGLIADEDEHRFAEVTDLIILCRLYLDYWGQDYDKLKRVRLKKFYTKLEGDKNGK